MNAEAHTTLPLPVPGGLPLLEMQGPRYTSYPTADRFVEAFGAEQYKRALEQRTSNLASASEAPVSLYVHVPFCESVCYYCACNKVVTRHHERATKYLDALEREIALHVQALGGQTPVAQVHLGGGTPTFLGNEELERLMIRLRRSFRVLPDAEISIEVDPRTVDRDRLGWLAALGFNRLSFGVQDFDPAVQAAVHRVQPYEQVQALCAAARDFGIRSINMDLIYGLPLQSPDSFALTVAQVAALRPERIALYAYAHLPQRFKPQRRILTEQLPPAGDKLAMLQGAITGFLGHGYEYIGMDHFALPDDALARAKREGRMQRNFQGYSTHADGDLIGLGVSAIGRVGNTYSQNQKTLDDYYDALDQQHFPTARGLRLSRDDSVRRAVIMALMCQGRVDFAAVEMEHEVDFGAYFRDELEQIAGLEESGLVQRAPQSIEVTATGWFFIRAVAMVFDRHLRVDKAARHRFSRIV